MLDEIIDYVKFLQLQVKVNTLFMFSIALVFSFFVHDDGYLTGVEHEQTWSSRSSGPSYY